MKKADSTHFYTAWDSHPDELAAFPHKQGDTGSPGRVVHDAGPSDKQAAASLAQGGAKSAAVDVHPAFQGPRMPSMTSSGKRFNPNAGTGKFESFK